MTNLSQTNERKGINNNTNDDQITALQKLCENILQCPRSLCNSSDSIKWV